MRREIIQKGLSRVKYILGGLGIPVVIALFSIGVNGEQAIIANIIELIFLNLLGGFFIARRKPLDYKLNSLLLGAGTPIWIMIMYLVSFFYPSFSFSESPLIFVLVLPLLLISCLGGWVGSKFPKKSRREKHLQIKRKKRFQPIWDDEKALRSDWEAVGNDLKWATGIPTNEKHNKNRKG